MDKKLTDAELLKLEGVSEETLAEFDDAEGNDDEEGEEE